MNVSIPRTNTNEDQALIADVAVSEGQNIDEGSLLCVVETTKAAVEVYAPAAGVISRLYAAKGDVVDVGMTFCDLDTATADSVREQKPVASSKEPRITAKARKRALEMGLDLDQLPKDIVVDIKFVERLAERDKAPSNAIVINHEKLIDPNAPMALINGGGGHAAAVIDALRGAGIRIEGVIDSIKPIGAEVLHGIKVVGREDILEQMWAKGIKLAFIGIGGASDNMPRQRVYSRLKKQGFDLPPVIHPKAYVAEDVEIGEGSLVLAGAVIGPRSRIGANVIINQGAQVCHDSIIGDHCHLAPGALVAGYCEIGDYSTVGMAATVLYHTRIGRDCLIHNGAAVVSDLPKGIELARDGQRFRREE